ncbi:hypothetical protein C0991_008437 [Blastosporella zonata]|nr:hypothetical protein C0991_008437 [Blastosporella zonata]
MAPTLRSSASNTPNGKSTGGQDPSSVTPRKAPVCSKCKRPRAGHPRSGCPYTISPTKSTKQAVPDAAGNTLVDALGSMQLQSPTRDDDTKATIRQRRRSSQAAALAMAHSVNSIDTEFQEIIDRLVEPGMFDNSIDGHETPTVAAKVVQWRDTMTPARPKRVKMPGSMSSPSPYSSQESIKLEESAPRAYLDEIINEDCASRSPQDSAAIPAPRPLVRSMSTEQRETFLSSLNSSSTATVYLVPRDDIHHIHAEAVKMGFYARIVLGKDPKDPQGLLIMGQDEEAVKRLHSQVELERKKSSRFSAAAGGAVVGAVGAFVGLAFA